MAATDNANQSLVVTAFWEVNPGEEAAVASLLKDFLPQAQREPGVKEFQIHQNLAEPRKYFFYEVFAGEAAFADHQQTPHFKNIIVGQAVPKLAKRERSQFRLHLTPAAPRQLAARCTSSSCRSGASALSSYARRSLQRRAVSEFLLARVAGEAGRRLERGARFVETPELCAGDRRERSATDDRFSAPARARGRPRSRAPPPAPRPCRPQPRG